MTRIDTRQILENVCEKQARVDKKKKKKKKGENYLLPIRKDDIDKKE